MWLTVEEAVRVTGRSERTIRRWLADGTLPKHEILEGPKKRRVQINSDDLERLGVDVHLKTLEDDPTILREHLRALEAKLAQRPVPLATLGPPERPPDGIHNGTTPTVSPTPAFLTPPPKNTQFLSDQPSQVGDLAIYYFEGSVSKGTCMKIAVRHGMAPTSAERFTREWPAEERRTYDDAVRFVYAHMTRPGAVKAFQLCPHSLCLCHDLT